MTDLSRETSAEANLQQPMAECEQIIVAFKSGNKQVAEQLLVFVCVQVTVHVLLSVVIFYTELRTSTTTIYNQ